MTRWAYYNENDAEMCAWLAELMKRGLIPEGEIDGRSIELVHADDVAGFRQAHFFAGIAGWSCAARLAGIPDDWPIWTGSCPCQPFSNSGRRKGAADPRHLWPHFFRIIRAARPARILGEQVADAPGWHWFNGVAADLEGAAYSCRAIGLCSAAIDAPDRRGRLFWGAVANGARAGRDEGRAECAGRQRHAATAGGTVPGGAMGDGDGAGLAIGESLGGDARAECAAAERTDAARGHYDGCEWIQCDGGKVRRAKPGIPLLAARLPGRVAMWRGLGNAVNAQLAAQVIAAFRESIEG